VVRQEKEVAEADAQQQRRKIRAAVDAAKTEGLPQGLEEREAYFLEQVQQGEQLSADRAFYTIPGRAE
jgi:mitochondrial import receptor subunit TOM20